MGAWCACKTLRDYYCELGGVFLWSVGTSFNKSIFFFLLIENIITIIVIEICHRFYKIRIVQFT